MKLTRKILFIINFFILICIYLFIYLFSHWGTWFWTVLVREWRSQDVGWYSSL